MTTLKYTAPRYAGVPLSIYISIYPVPRVQSPSSSATVQSLASASSRQIRSASAKVLSRLQPRAPHSSDPPQTMKQLDFFTQPGRALSEQQRTCMAVGIRARGQSYRASVGLQSERRVGLGPRGTVRKWHAHAPRAAR